MAIIAAANIVIFLDIPFLRQFLGVIFLLMSGLLILLLLKLNKLELAEKIVLTIGLSIAFLMLFGLALNQISVWVGYEAPLSTLPLAISLSLASVVLLVAAYVRNREAFLSNPFHLDLNRRSKLCLLLPSIFPLMSVLGTRFLSTSDNNAILLVLLFLIPVCIILFVWQRRNLSKDTYPVAIMMISSALLMYYWLSSEHILGSDVHLEYYYFYTTLLNQHWSIIENLTLDSCLSISLLPTIFQSLLQMPAEEQFFKGVYVLICSFTPLSVYVISRKYLGETYALLAAFFFISHGLFLTAPGVPRVNVAIFFFALYIMVLLHSEISGATRTGLLIIFMVATIFSHYSTSYIFFFLLLFACLSGLIFRKFALARRMTLTSVGLFLALIFLWYSQLTGVPFSSGVGFIRRTIMNLSLFAVEEARAPDVGLLVAEGLAGRPFLSWVNFVITWVSFILIAVGVIGTLIKRKEILTTSQWGNPSPPFLRARLDSDFFLLAAVSSAMLVAVVVLPYVSIGYETGRVYGTIMVVLACFLILGGIIAARYLRISSLLLILLILIPYSLFATGVIYEATGIHGVVTLSPEAPGHTSHFVQEQEVPAAQWLKEHIGENSQIYAFDGNTTDKLISQGKFSLYVLHHYSAYQHSGFPGYIYLGYNNVVNGKFRVGSELGDMSVYSDEFVGKSKLYANGGSEIWR